MAALAHFLRVVVASLLLAALSDALHCLLQDHCGENAVCVTKLGEPNPKCMCLLGYRGNGANCLPVDSTDASVRYAGSLGNGKRQVVIQKCAATAGDSRLPVVDAPFAAATASAGVVCAAVECDFDLGACSFKNAAGSSWALRTINKGAVLAVTGENQKEQFVLSGDFTLERPARLYFDYFDSSSTRGHLRLFSKSLASQVWMSEARGSGWRPAVATLQAGHHQLIFVGQVSGGQLLAVDNLRLADVGGGTALCL